MEHGTVVDNTRDELATKNRFESFKLGKGLPSSVPQKHSHARSHSRNNSSIASVPFSISSKSMNAADTPNPTPPSKRNSHHRRRSSVSTRIESAEMMGVAIPDLPPTTSEDNINLGEKDSIRRRALWALEGKPDVAFSKVEIPELSTPVMEKMMFDLTTKPPQPQSTVPSYGQSINILMANKRDSFKLLGASSSSKDQLHTLVEEEEEEEEEGQEALLVSQEAEPNSKPAAPITPVTPAFSFTKPTPARPRPATLNLRPLSLTPENLVNNTTTGLPTPSLTPSPRLGLKALSLVPSNDENTNTTIILSSASPSPLPHRPPLSLNLPERSYVDTFSEDKGRRSSISYRSSSGSEGPGTNYGLPTPDTATNPTFERRQSAAITDALRRRRSGSSSSAASVDDESFTSQPSRPLSASEQHFLFKSHNALLTRITDLERALSMRRMSSGTNNNSRPASIASDFSSDYGSNGEPSDEMLRLVADLKAERDDLKRDVDGWRTRVADMEKQLGVVAGRMESERRDAWVARSMSGLLEVEKGELERKLAGVEKIVLALEADKKALELENAESQRRITSLSNELDRVKQELAQEKTANREVTVVTNQDMLAMPTSCTPEPRPRPHGFISKRITSVDSDATEVEESLEDSPKFNFSLKSVVEDEEDISDEDNGLAGYEEEDESDIIFQSSSSFGSEDDFHRSVAHLQDVPVSVTPRSVSPPVVHAPRPTHANRASISKTWTFPMGAQVSKPVIQEEPEVDRFFGCLEDDDNSDGFVPSSPSAYSYEKSKGLFASGFKYGGDDEDAPFFFPLGAGVEVESPKTLEVVQEEKEDEMVHDDDNMFGEAGGIQITFTPPEAEEGDSFDSQRLPSPPPAKSSVPTINFFDFDEEEKSMPFNFGRPLQEKANDNNVFSTPPPRKLFNFGRPTVDTVVKKSEPQLSTMITPSFLPRPTSPQASPSSIPRAKVIKSSPFADPPISTPPRPTQGCVVSNRLDSPNAYITPPSRRGGNMPSLIPQAVSSPSPVRSASTGATAKAASGPSATFIRQPLRKPLMLASDNTKSQINRSGASHGSTFAPQISAMLKPVMNASSLSRSPDHLHTTTAHSAHSEMKSVDLSDHFNIDTTNISASTTPWQQYPSTSRDCIISSSSLDPSTAPPAKGPPSSSSPFSSIMTSPLSSRISLQSFTNFIPLSWSQRSIASPALISDATECIQEVNSAPTQVRPVTPLKRGFVSKEKQLEKLRCRLERENFTQVKTSLLVSCKKCGDDDAVVL